MRKKRVLCLFISVLMIFCSAFINVSACDPVWFEIRDLMDKATPLQTN